MKIAVLLLLVASALAMDWEDGDLKTRGLRGGHRKFVLLCYFGFQFFRPGMFFLKQLVRKVPRVNMYNSYPLRENHHI